MLKRWYICSSLFPSHDKSCSRECQSGINNSFCTSNTTFRPSVARVFKEKDLNVAKYLPHKEIYFFPMAQRALVGQGPSFSSLRHRIQTHHIRQDSSARVIRPKQISLHDNTQHSKQTDTRALDGIITHNPSKRSTAVPCLTTRGHCDLHTDIYVYIFTSSDRQTDRETDTGKWGKLDP